MSAAAPRLGAPGPGPAARPTGGTGPTAAAGPAAATAVARDCPWPQAREAARQAAGAPLPAVECEPAEALGRALARPLTALTDLPAFDTSAMDGWAVSGPGPWRLAGRVLAGRTPPPLADGWATGIATGAQLPPGATAVLRREHGRVEPPAPTGGATGGVLRQTVQDGPAPGQDVRPRGQECHRGEELLPAGTPVTAAVLGLAAACGYDRLTVRRRPTVELLVLGDELVTAGLPGPGLVRDALGPLLQPWLRTAGAELLGRRAVRDDFALLRDAVRYSPAEVVITTGGTAAGPVDFLHAALAEIGARLLVDGVAVRPGHPMLLAELPPAHPGGACRHLVGLPGNPLAAVVGAVTLALPLLHRLTGRPAGGPTGPDRFARAAVELPGHPEDTRLLPVRQDERGALPLAFDGPAMLRGLALADALAVVPPGGLAAGDRVELLGTPG